MVAALFADVPQRRLDARGLLDGEATRPDCLDELADWRSLHGGPVRRGAGGETSSSPAGARLVDLHTGPRREGRAERLECGLGVSCWPDHESRASLRARPVS